jgi:hypothetical protein
LTRGAFSTNDSRQSTFKITVLFIGSKLAGAAASFV